MSGGSRAQSLWFMMESGAKIGNDSILTTCCFEKLRCKRVTDILSTHYSPLPHCKLFMKSEVRGVHKKQGCLFPTAHHTSSNASRLHYQMYTLPQCFFVLLCLLAFFLNSGFFLAAELFVDCRFTLDCFFTVDLFPYTGLLFTLDCFFSLECFLTLYYCFTLDCFNMLDCFLTLHYFFTLECFYILDCFPTLDCLFTLSCFPYTGLSFYTELFPLHWIVFLH